MIQGIARLFRRPADVIIGGEENPYLKRWHIIPRNRLFNIYLHQFLRDDDDRALHDHPWASLSIVLKGAYREHLPPRAGCLNLPLLRLPGHIVFRTARHAHRIELEKIKLYRKTHAGFQVRTERSLPAWTLFITGPKVREWGFHCPQGWRHWRDFTSDDGVRIGRGCE